jgi:hypothetical protein
MPRKIARALTFTRPGDLSVTAETMPNTPGREFARRFVNLLSELQLQQGIYRRIENLMGDWATEHPNLRASYLSREVDASYFEGDDCPPEAASRPRMQAIAVEGERMYEFVAFAHGFRRDVAELDSIVHIQETWLEPKPEEPFTLRVALYHTFPATTVLMASTGEQCDLIQDFLTRVKYLKGW